MDFSTLVLGPCMNSFQVPATFVPLLSNPAGAPYVARGIWTVKDVDMMLQDGSIVASKGYELGIRLSEFSIPPIHGDIVSVNGGTYQIDMVRPDGQGGARLILKAVTYNADKSEQDSILTTVL